MKNRTVDSSLLIKLQTYSWYFLLTYFAIAFCVYTFEIQLPIDLGMVGVFIILGLTLLKLLLIAEQFRKIQIKRITFIAYGLLLLVSITILLRLL